MINLQTVRPADRTFLWNVHQKYLYEMTNFYADEMDGEGNYHYGHFEEYFTDPRRQALLIRLDGLPAGFAMVHPYSYFEGGRPDFVMAEFTVFPAFRRKRVALEAASLILAERKGDWEIKYSEKNRAAKALWNRLAQPYLPQKVSYAPDETVLLFSNRQASVFYEETDDHLALSALFAESGLDVKVQAGKPEGVLKMWRACSPQGQLLGGAVLQEKGGRYILKDLAVQDGWRGRGIGCALMERALAEASSLGAKEIWGCAKVPAYYAAKGWRVVDDSEAPRISDCQSCGQYLTSCFPKIICKDL